MKLQSLHTGHRLAVSAYSDVQGIRSVALVCTDCREVLHRVEFYKACPIYYVASPLNASTPDGILANMMMARKYEQDVAAVVESDAIVIAPHAWIPELMDDNDAIQRKTALLYGLTVLKGCNALVLCGTRITGGMFGEVAAAQAAGIPILQFVHEGGGRLLMAKEMKATG